MDEHKAVEFKVADTGIGIAHESLPFVFELFRQVDSSTTRPYEGVGLGLYIAKKYCELLAGEISVQSKLGQGSTFLVRIPIEPSR
jgi:signal transduction histidine kinase